LFSFSNNLYRKLLLSLLVFSFLTGCASTNKQQNLPLWVLEPPVDNSQSIYGIGEGVNLDTAKQSALKKIASNFSINVASNTSIKESVYNDKSDFLFQQNVETSVKNIELTQYELLKTEHANGLYYVMLSISRPEFIVDKQGKLNSIINSIEIELKNISQKNKVEQLYRYNKVLLWIQQAEPLLHLLSVVDGNFNSTKYENLFKHYIESEKHLLATTYFYINSDKKLNSIAALINSSLQTYGFQITNKANADGIIYINGKIHQADVFSTKNVRIDFNILVKSKQEQIYKKSTYTINGSSISSYKSAEEMAINRFSNQIKSKSDIYHMLGFDEKI